MPHLRPLQAITLTAALLAATAPHAAFAQNPQPTPRIGNIESIAQPGGTTYIMRAALPNDGTIVGLAATCLPRLEVTVYFGGYPADGRPVQLAVRETHGSGHRFGPVERGCLTCGFHSPQVRSADAARFVDAALRTGALVSNGFVSFFNEAQPSRNLQVRTELLGCPR